MNKAIQKVRTGVSPGARINSLRTLALSLVLGALACSALGNSTGSWAQKLDSFAQARATGQHLKDVSTLIVRFRGTLTPVESTKLRRLGAKVEKHLRIVDSYVLKVRNKNIKKLANLPFVEHVSTDVTVTKKDEFTFEHSLANVAFGEQSLTGEGVTIAVLDSGINSCPDLLDPATGQSRVIASVDFAPNSSSALDAFGHGTHVAGIIAGNGASSSGVGFFRTFYGVARKAKLVNVHVLNAAGSSSVSQFVAALEWVLANKDNYNIKVVNLSVGHPVGESYRTDPLCQAVETLWKSGVVVVCAAGNDGRANPMAMTSGGDNEGYGTNYGSITVPGNDPYVITVGAMKKTGDGSRDLDAIATYSSRGPTRLDLRLKPDVVAPGNRVVSLRRSLSTLELQYPSIVLPLNSYYMGTNGLAPSSYSTLSGTSMATPVVSGAVALMLQADPSLTPDTIKARLMVSADKWLDQSGNANPFTFGAGYLNVKAALASTVTASSWAMSPCVIQPTSGTVNLVLDSSVYGDGGFWGTGITDLRAIWGNRAIWGTGTLASDRALWGNSVWSDRAMWGTDTFSIGIGPGD